MGRSIGFIKRGLIDKGFPYFGWLIAIQSAVIKVALKFNIVDKPDGALKTQKDAIPYLGGLAVYLSFMMSLSIILDFNRSFLGLLLGATLIVLLGIFDDLIELSPAFKLIGQCLAFWVLFRSGVRIQLIDLPPLMAIGLSFVWLVIVTNAFNIIDVKVCRHWTGQRGIELTDLPPFIEGVSSADQESKRLESAGYAYF